eukprot:PITA_35362
MIEGLILGHYISAAGIQVDPAKIQIILLIPTPTTQTEVRNFLGFSGYYRRFIEQFSHIAAPLYALIGNFDILWKKKCERAFQDLNKLVSTAPVLQGPNWDLPFQISSNASNTAIGAVLGQEEDKKPYTIYYISKNLSPAELNYIVTEKEFLAIIHVVNKFRHYITGYPIILYIDHYAIKYLANKPIKNGRITRWLILLQEFNITIKDRPGRENLVANFLSRIPRLVDTTVVEDQFLDEHLFVVIVKTPWYANVVNYLAVGADMHIRRCVREEENFDILKACHEGSCGSYFAYHRTGHKVLQIGYYWPTIFKDAKKFVQACESCQRTGRPGQSDEMPLNPQLVIEPFERWALDFIGPINPSSNQKTYILVAIEYVTKWVEAEALLRATEDSIIQFLFHIFVCYGLPRDIITDGGPQFVGNKIVATLKNYHIQNKITSPYHPQANGQVESNNKIIEAILTKTIASHKRDWVARLPKSLWAYRTTWRSITGYSPYQLVFGKEPIFPIEFEIQTLRIAQEVGLDLNEAQINRLQKTNEID